MKMNSRHSYVFVINLYIGSDGALGGTDSGPRTLTVGPHVIFSILGCSVYFVALNNEHKHFFICLICCVCLDFVTTPPTIVRPIST